MKNADQVLESYPTIILSCFKKLNSYGADPFGTVKARDIAEAFGTVKARDIAEAFGTVKARDIAEPFGTSKARDMATGKVLQKKVEQNLIKADKFGDEIYSSFVNEHIKVNLDIGLKKMKNIWKTALV